MSYRTPKEQAKEIERILTQIKRGKYKQKEGDYSRILILRQESYIKAKYKYEPYIDKPSQMNKIFDRWILTPKGKQLLIKMKKHKSYIYTHKDERWY